MMTHCALIILQKDSIVIFYFHFFESNFNYDIMIKNIYFSLRNKLALPLLPFLFAFPLLHCSIKHVKLIKKKFLYKNYNKTESLF